MKRRATRLSANSSRLLRVAPDVNSRSEQALAETIGQEDPESFFDQVRRRPGKLPSRRSCALARSGSVRHFSRIRMSLPSRVFKGSTAFASHSTTPPLRPSHSLAPQTSRTPESSRKGGSIKHLDRVIDVRSRHGIYTISLICMPLPVVKIQISTRTMEGTSPPSGITSTLVWLWERPVGDHKDSRWVVSCNSLNEPTCTSCHVL